MFCFDSGLASLSKSSDSLLGSTCLKEFSRLQSCIVTAVWDSIRQTIGGKIKR